MSDERAQLEQEVERRRLIAQVEAKRAYVPVSERPPLKSEGVDVKGMATGGALGVSQGLTLGFADEIGGATRGLVDYAKGKLGLRGDISLGDAYRTNRDSLRKMTDTAAAESPKSYIAGQIGGGIATALVPGAGALSAGKGAGIMEAVGKGALQGGVAGAGNARNLEDTAGEAARGAAIGGAIGGAFNVGGKVASAVADKFKPAKMASVLLNAPEKAIDRYIKNPDAVNAARSRTEIVNEAFLPRLDALKGEVSAGSKASRQILTDEGGQISGTQIAQILDDKADEIVARAEGILDDPQLEAAVKYLKDAASKYKPGEDGVEKAVSTNRVKDLIQTLDKRIDFDTAPGRMAQVDDLIKKDVRRSIDTLLKGQSPAYAGQMKEVAKDTALLSDVSGLARTPQGFDGLLKRTQRGTAPMQREALEAFDARTGGGLLEELENAAAKDALTKGATNGSRNVLLGGGVGDAVSEFIGMGPIGRTVGRTAGFLWGATVDKFGPKMAKQIVDSSIKVNRLLQNSKGIQDLGSFARPLIDAATRGNQSLAATHAYLFASEPDYRKRIENIAPSNAVDRRIQRTGE